MATRGKRGRNKGQPNRYSDGVPQNQLTNSNNKKPAPKRKIEESDDDEVVRPIPKSNKKKNEDNGDSVSIDDVDCKSLNSSALNEKIIALESTQEIPAGKSKLDSPSPSPSPTNSSSGIDLSPMTSSSSDFSKLEELIKESLSKINKKLDEVLATLPKGKYAVDTTKVEDMTIGSDDDRNYTTENGVNLLRIKVADPEKYALALMDAIFTDEEMASHCYSSSKRTKKPPLSEEKKILIDECIKKRFGEASLREKGHIIRKKCNQKCIDICNKKIKKEKEGKKETEEEKE